MSNHATKPGQGYFVIKKTAGVASPAVGTQTFIPVKAANPRNPRNISRSDTISKAASIVTATKGKFTPSCGFVAPAKATWFTQLLLNSLIGGSAAFVDPNLDTDQYGMGMYEPVLNATRVWDDIRFAALTINYQAAGGDILVNASGPGVFGESEKGTPTSFSTPTVDFGQNYNTSDVVITGADQVRAFSFTLLRGQGQMMEADGTLYPITVASGKAGGLFTLEQSGTFGTTFTSTITIQIGPATTGVKFVFSLDLDELVTDFTTSFGTTVKSATMTDLSAGGYPFTISAGT